MLNGLIETKTAFANSGGNYLNTRMYTVPTGRLAIVHIKASVKFNGGGVVVDGKLVPFPGSNNSQHHFVTVYATSYIDAQFGYRCSATLNIMEYSRDVFKV